ncbi:FAD-binding domain-containing protein [Jackrogersella minutella]|nr:FAD-binding domain-containing protein [Jackrogersella minutella]
MYSYNRNFLLLMLLPLFVAIVKSNSTKRQSRGDECRSIPGDDSWPTPEDWDSLNDTVEGRLIATVPIAAPCHNDFSTTTTTIDTYNEDQCDSLRRVWFFPETHLPSSSSPMAYTFSHNSCNPFLDPSVSCTLGNLVAYTINATNAWDIQQGLDFAKRHNVRLVIRNTGHDYLGKSTGANSLGLWTHNLKSLELIGYDGVNYTGFAIQMGAGVEAIEAYNFANSHGLVVVGSNCPTVGIAGGYTQGGGYGPLASTHGLSADQVLEWDVLLENGTMITANNTHHSDIFWALGGGGGGTFGVVMSMTVKAFHDNYTSSAYLTVPYNGTNRKDIYGFVSTFLNILPSIVDAGVFARWVVDLTGFTLMPAFVHAMHIGELDVLLKPALDHLDSLKMEYQYSSAENTSFLSAYTSLPLACNVSDFNTGGRLIPRSVVINNTVALVKAIQYISSRAVLIGASFNVKGNMLSPDQVAVNPYIRDALFTAVVGVPVDYTDWTANIKTLDDITDELLPVLEALTPNGGAYLNDGDSQQSGFQSVFYGDHYEQLLQIKRSYDPDHIFWAKTAVGSELWEERDGRLCRVGDY